jgi:hypothetical protein
MKKTKYTILYSVFVRTFVILFYCGSGSVINYGSDSNFLKSYGSGSGYITEKSYGSYDFGSGSGSTTLTLVYVIKNKLD